MRLKSIQWEIKSGKPKNNSKEIFRITGTFFNIINDIDSFTITNEYPYFSKSIASDLIYLKQSITYRYGRKVHTLTFKTIEEAKKRAQEICLKKLTKQFFIKERKITRKILIEKLLGKY